jgi:hypothetical protein
VPVSSLRIDPLPRQGVTGVLNKALNALGVVTAAGAGHGSYCSGLPQRVVHVGRPTTSGMLADARSHGGEPINASRVGRCWGQEDANSRSSRLRRTRRR